MGQSLSTAQNLTNGRKAASFQSFGGAGISLLTWRAEAYISTAWIKASKDSLTYSQAFPRATCAHD
jgi:hypothetical protein